MSRFACAAPPDTGHVSCCRNSSCGSISFSLTRPVSSGRTTLHPIAGPRWANRFLALRFGSLPDDTRHKRLQTAPCLIADLERLNTSAGPSAGSRTDHPPGSGRIGAKPAAHSSSLQVGLARISSPRPRSHRQGRLPVLGRVARLRRASRLIKSDRFPIGQ